MTDKELDKIIGDKLLGYKEEAPLDMFSKIEKSMAAEAPAPNGKSARLSSVYRYITAAAVVAVMAVVSLFVWDYAGSETLTAEEIVNSTDIETIDANEIILREQKRLSAPDREPNIAEVILQTIENDIRKSLDNQVVVTQNAEPLLDGEESDAELYPVDRSLKHASVDNQAARKDEDEELRKRLQLEREREIEEYWAQMFREDFEEESNHRRTRLTTALYGGNFGVGSGNNYNLANAMTVNESSASMAPSLLASSPTKTPTGEMLPNVNLRHRMPINAGVSIAFPITPKLSIMSGVNYSYLYSSTTQQISSINSYKFAREQHYIGIPVSVVYSIHSGKVVDFYAKGGGAVEKAVAVKEITTSTMGNNTESNKNSVRVKGVQPSVDAGIGANFNLGKGVGLYLEPGIAYYFDMPNQPSSYRTEHPLNFTVRIGVRFDIKSKK